VDRVELLEKEISGLEECILSLVMAIEVMQKAFDKHVEEEDNRFKELEEDVGNLTKSMICVEDYLTRISGGKNGGK